MSEQKYWGDPLGTNDPVRIERIIRDKNGRMTFPLSFVDRVINVSQGTGQVDPGGASDAQIIQITVAAGAVLAIYNIVLMSETGVKAVGIGTSSDNTFSAPFSGMADAALLWVGLTGSGAAQPYSNDKNPLVVVDNSGGSSSLYCYIFAYTGFLDIAQVSGEKVGASYSGILKTLNE